MPGVLKDFCVPTNVQKIYPNTNESRKVWVQCLRNLDCIQARVPLDGTMKEEDLNFHVLIIFLCISQEQFV